jgi:uncharacterized protein YegJ (DUF2314 family)
LSCSGGTTPNGYQRGRYPGTPYFDSYQRHSELSLMSTISHARLERPNSCAAPLTQASVKRTNMKKALLIIMAVALSIGASCSRSVENETETYKHVQNDDQAMNAAIKEAKESSAVFLRASHTHKPGTNDFYVKKPYATPSKDNEHMWIEVTKEENGVLSGVIANEAEETREVKMGDVVSLNLSEITDWKYMNGKKLIGGYTIRYFVSKMSPKEKSDFLKEAGFEL